MSLRGRVVHRGAQSHSGSRQSPPATGEGGVRLEDAPINSSSPINATTSTPSTVLSSQHIRPRQQHLRHLDALAAAGDAASVRDAGRDAGERDAATRFAWAPEALARLPAKRCVSDDISEV